MPSRKRRLGLRWGAMYRAASMRHSRRAASRSQSAAVVSGIAALLLAA